MKIKTVDLPGIGKRYSFETAEHENVVVILHQSGHRELYYFAGSDEDVGIQMMVGQPFQF